jgi:hypothetical protein
LLVAIEAVRQAQLKQPKGDRAFADLLLAARDIRLEQLEVSCQFVRKHQPLSAAFIRDERRRFTYWTACA